MARGDIVIYSLIATNVAAFVLVWIFTFQTLAIVFGAISLLMIAGWLFDLLAPASRIGRYGFIAAFAIIYSTVPGFLALVVGSWILAVLSGNAPGGRYSCEVYGCF